MPRVDPGNLRVAVADLVFGDAACAARAVATLDAAGPTGWASAIGLAAHWGVIHDFRRHVDERRLDAESRARLRSAALALAMRSTVVVHRSAAALGTLDAAGIRNVVIKGVGLIAALRRSPAARATSDLDIVVAENDVALALHALRAVGFRDVGPAFERRVSDIALSRMLHNFAHTLRRDELEIDLHWRFGPRPPRALDATRLLARAIEVPLGEVRARVADPVDGALLNVHHALRGAFIPHNTLRDLTDLKLWWDEGAVAERAGELIDAALESDLAPSLAALWGAILRRDPAHSVRAGYDALRARLDAAARSEAVLLERYFEEQLRLGGASCFTLEIFAPRIYVRSLAGQVVRAIRGRTRRDAPREARAKPRPLTVRLAHLVPRLLRVLREMSRLDQIPAYRAVARAQSRFH